MEQIYIYTATTKKEYTWYQFNSENRECLINIQPSYWEFIQRYLPPGGHLPGLSIMSDKSNGIKLCISGIKSHRLEKNTSQIVDTILISSSTSNLSNTQLVLIQKFLEGTPISIDIDDPFTTSTYSEWFTKLSECITNNGEGGVMGINLDFEKFKNIISESSISIRDLQFENSNIDNDTESEIALDTLENRLEILKNLNRYVHNYNFPIALLITYGINPKELEGNVFKGLTVHSKAKTDLSGRRKDQYNVIDDIKPTLLLDQIRGKSAVYERDEERTGSEESDKVGKNDNVSKEVTQIKFDTIKILGIAITSAGLVIGLFNGKITIITSMITGAGVYLYSKRNKR